MFMFTAIFTLSGSLLYSSTTLLEKNSLLTSKLAGGLVSRAWYPLWPLVDVAPSACYRTPLENCKVLLTLDPTTDPLAIVCY